MRTRTQRELVLRHLEIHGSITPLEALSLYGCFRLAPRIHELRAQGHDIQTTMIQGEDGAVFAKYTLEMKKAERGNALSAFVDQSRGVNTAAT